LKIIESELLLVIYYGIFLSALTSLNESIKKSNGNSIVQVAEFKCKCISFRLIDKIFKVKKIINICKYFTE